MRRRRFEILLSLRFNDGSPIPGELFDQAREELVVRFGSVSMEPGTVQGVWVHQGTRYEDNLRRYVVDAPDAPESQAFFASFKSVLLQRFQQIDVYITSFSVDTV